MEKHQENGEIVTHLSQTEARSGSRTKVTRLILVVSLVLAVIVLAVVLLFGNLRTDATGADTVNTDNRSAPASP